MYQRILLTMKKNKTTRILSVQETNERGLLLRRGNTRSDGFIFRYYYVKINKSSGEESRKVYEKWTSPKALDKYKKSLMALHFHHTGPKKKEVSGMLAYSRKALKEEVRNCILVCSNCHCEIHEDEQKEV